MAYHFLASLFDLCTHSPLHNAPFHSLGTSLARCNSSDELPHSLDLACPRRSSAPGRRDEDRSRALSLSCFEGGGTISADSASTEATWSVYRSYNLYYQRSLCACMQCNGW